MGALGQNDEQKSVKERIKEYNEALRDRQAGIEHVSKEQRLAMTPEEQRAAGLSPKEQQRLAKEQRKAAEEKKKAEAAFAASPPGLARSAFQRGDHVFQASFDLANTSTYHILMKTGAWSTAQDPTALLNAICDEGWS